MQTTLPNTSTNLLLHNMMNLKHSLFKKLTFLKLASLFTLLLVSNTSFAVAEGDVPLPDAPEGVIKIQITNPERDVGYTVGDILKRVITLEVKKPYSLVNTSIPIVGYERRWKGKVIGIDVSSVKLSETDHDSSHIYVIDVDYQVLTNNVVAKPGALPAEILHFKFVNAKGKASLVQYRVPSWNFRISPLAVFGSVKVEQDMSGLRGPLVLDAKTHQRNRDIATGILALVLLGLLYILGNRAWLPRMGAPFAKALRDLRKLPDNQQGLQQAVSRLHLALNKTAQHTVFKGGVDEFIAQKPAFAEVRNDLLAFFEVSRHAFFESTPNPDSKSQNLAWLKAFARHCRDCERGLTPDVAPASSKA
ncbi:MAG TPA: hypothetical protein VK949_05510 [Methylotenera sp.]|nr:hypothetical protein [Methylotenera sp.]